MDTVIVNCVNGKRTVREMTPEEEIRRLADIARWTAIIEAEEQAIADRRAAIGRLALDPAMADVLLALGIVPEVSS